MVLANSLYVSPFADMEVGQVRGVETKSRKGIIRQQVIFKRLDGLVCYSTMNPQSMGMLGISLEKEPPCGSSIMRCLSEDEISVLKARVVEWEQWEAQRPERERAERERREQEARIAAAKAAERRAAHEEQATVGSLLKALKDVPPGAPLVISAISSHYKGSETWSTFLLGVEKCSPEGVRFAKFEKFLCRGRTAKGNPCRNSAGENSFYCYIHATDKDEGGGAAPQIVTQKELS